MDPDNQWRQEIPQDGLFTIYFNGNPLIPYSKQQPQMHQIPKTVISKFKSETKIKAFHRLHSEPNSLNTSKRGQSTAKHFKTQQKCPIFTKILQTQVAKSFQQLERARTQTTLQVSEKPESKFHIQNIMEHFAYEISKPYSNREKARTDENTHLRTPSKMSRTDRQHEMSRLQTSRRTVERSKAVNDYRVINSDNTKISHPRYKGPLVSYLLKYRQFRGVAKNEARPIKEKQGLYSVVKINHPYQDQRQERRATQK